MGLFKGIYEHTVGDKYRLSIPSDARTQTSTVGLFLYDGGEPSLLYLLPGDFEGGLEQYTQRLLEQSPSPLNGDFNLETMLKVVDAQVNIKKLEWDENGRTVISTLRETGIKPGQKVCIVGVGKYLLLFLGDKSQLKDYLKEKTHPTLDPTQS
ncbi:MAG: hypothetical protein AABX37_02985 [Nanoarchaeota archaeon]